MNNAIVPVSKLEWVVGLVTDSVSSPETKRKYAASLRDFLDWWGEAGRPQLSKSVVQQYTAQLQEAGMGASSINLRLSAIRKLAGEAADNGLLDPVMAGGIQRVRGVRQEGQPTGNWLTRDQAQELLRKPDISTITGIRDRAILAVFLGCGLRRSEVASLTFEDVQQREGRWVIVDLVGKRNKTRTVPMPSWCRAALDDWSEASGIGEGRVFVPINKGGRVAGGEMSPQALYYVIRKYTDLAPHDLRRTFAKLAHGGGSDILQVQLSLGHSSVKVTESYLGVDQDLVSAPCDHLGLQLI